ncbi:MAG: hypothetical protein JNK27_00045 [Chitinophagaceae bacterium]|nr:hypothetical protein [Chitinophagaceae bacterium]
MFEKLIQELQRINGTHQISVPIRPDKDGYVDKECPDKKCLFQFKVHEDDWKNIFKEEKVFCPMCRNEAAAKSWFTAGQIKWARQRAKEHIHGMVNNAFIEGARHFNENQPRNSFLKMSMNFTGKPGMKYIVPIAAGQAMELKIACKECSARYAVIGSAFFCPCCGHNSAEETFENAVRKVEAKIQNIELVRTSLLAVSKDAAENTCRSMIETSLNECVVAFQRFNEVSFAKKFPAVNIRMNAFQNLEAGAGYWQQNLGKSYSDWISQTELDELVIYFQRRHLLCHTEGIVDQRYIDNSRDPSYQVGQRVIVKEKDVTHCLRIIQKVIESLKAEL